MGLSGHFLRHGNRGEERPGQVVGRNRRAEGHSGRFDRHHPGGIPRARPRLGRRKQIESLSGGFYLMPKDRPRWIATDKTMPARRLSAQPKRCSPSKGRRGDEMRGDSLGGTAVHLRWAPLFS
jgi:hypothetical protein